MSANFRRLTLVGVLVVVVVLGSAGRTVWGQDHKEASGLNIQVPDSGPITQRVKQFWQTTRPIIEADAQASLSEARYQARRNVLFAAWVRLQAAPNSTDDVGRLIPRILELIDHVYGFPGYSEVKRIKKRQNVGRTNYLLKEIDRRVDKLPG
jgi:hypothetical protein